MNVVRVHAVAPATRLGRRPLILHGVAPSSIRHSYRSWRRDLPAIDARAHTVASWVGLADAIEVGS